MPTFCPPFCPRCKRRQLALPDKRYCLKHQRDFLRVSRWGLVQGLPESDRYFIYEHFSTCTAQDLMDYLGLQLPRRITRALGKLGFPKAGRKSHVPLMVMIKIIIEKRST